ncbi:MAG TPA: discoidin domain-containing protein, partial [Polyangiales bacterium]
LVPVSGANLPDGRVLLWSAEERFSFGTDRGRTYSLTFDPASNGSTERLVSETAHDMFCPGTANLADGRILVNGGLSSAKTSIFNPATGVWSAGAAMNIPRAYQGTVPLADGSVLTLGGSWSGGVGNKHGELWTEAGGWRRLPGVLIDPFLSVDSTRDFGMDSHFWLVPSGNGKVFHAGPGINMNWIDTKGDGRVSAAGRRGDDEFSINGSAVMYDIGKILKTGGAPGYDGPTSNANSYVIDVNNGVGVRKLQSMAYRRAFHNSVVLPNGQVIIVGGMTVAIGFSDSNSVLTPELFDPLTETFVALPPMNVPRNYHSLALLLPDGRVLSTGGGLCGANCAANHADLQILSPPYLFDPDGSPAQRPNILSAPAQAAHGSEMSVLTDTGVRSFALVRMTSVTHAVNNDQRRVPLTFRELGPNDYAVRVPTNPGWALPGLYMLFAMDAQGVPSVAKVVRIGTADALLIRAIDDQGTSLGADTNLALSVLNPSGLPLAFSATGLPPGLSIQASTGTIQGNATQLGRYPVEVFATSGDQSVSTQFVWTVSDPGSTRYVMLEALTEVAGNPWSSAAEINLLDDNGQVMPRGAWTVSADSAELAGENGAPSNAIDGNTASVWHTQWQGANPPPPHRFTIDLGGAFKVRGLRYLPRQDTGNNGSIAQFRVYVSSDGVNWGVPVSSGNFVNLGAAKAEKTVYFDNVARGKSALQSSTSGAQVAARAVDGNTNGAASGNSIAITNSEATPFFEVDLGASYQTFGVRLWNRTDSASAALTNFYVLGADAPMTGRSLSALLADSSVAGVQVPGAAGNVLLVNLSARARYVRVQLAGTNPLQLAEVEVFGRLGENRAPALTQLNGVDSVLGAATTLNLPGSDPDGDSLTYAASGLPPGLTLAPNTGVVSGTPSVAGSYLVETSVADGRGASATMLFVWFVGVPLPVINAMAVPAISSGGSASYTAATNANAAFEYKWSFGDGTPDTDYASSPSINHVFTAPGVYYVTLTVRNSEGGASSREFVQAVTRPAIAGSPRTSSQLAFEPRSGASTRLWLVNPDNNSVTLFDTANNTKLREVTVGAAPRSVARASDGRIWVVNKGASSISIINPGTFAIAQTISLPRGAQPYGLVIGADGNAYVALEALGRVLKLNNAGSTLATLDVGGSPRHLALSAAGDRLFVSRFVTPVQPGEGSAYIDAVNGGASLLLVSPGNLTLAGSIKLRFSDKPDTTVSGRGVPNYLGALAISPDGASGWLPSKQDNIERGTLRDALNIDFQNTVRAISSRIDLGTLSEDYPARVDHDNSGLASAAAYHPNGAFLFVTLETSRELAVLDAAGKRELFRVDTGRAPQSLAISADGRTLYVQNFMDRNLSVFDLRRLVEFGEARLPLLSTLGSVATDLLAAQVLRGKQLFYDARDPRLAR